jgi:hypothetical protein
LEWVEGLPPKLRDKLARWGILDAVGVASGKPLAHHLTDYKQALLDGVASPKQKGPATQKHADLVAYRVQKILDGIGGTAQADVTVEAVGRYLAGRRTKNELSVQSSNNYVKDAKAFFNWLVRSRRASSNPIAVGIASVQLIDGLLRRQSLAEEVDQVRPIAVPRIAKGGGVMARTPDLPDA